MGRRSALQTGVIRTGPHPRKYSRPPTPGQTHPSRPPSCIVFSVYPGLDCFSVAPPSSFTIRIRNKILLCPPTMSPGLTRPSWPGFLTCGHADFLAVLECSKHSIAPGPLHFCLSVRKAVPGTCTHTSPSLCLCYNCCSFSHTPPTGSSD